MQLLLSFCTIDINCSKVQYLFVPAYKGLAVHDFLAKVKDYPQVEAYLPDVQDRHRLPRQWVINIISSVVGKPFAVWTHNIVSQRNDVFAEKNDKMMAMDPEIAKHFYQSNAISSKCLY